MAIASNVGSQPMSRDDRKRIAEYLYGKREWTMERIAEALNVSTFTVSKDLEVFSSPKNPPRPKGGRPKGSGKPKTPKRRNKAITPDVEQKVARDVLDEGKTLEQAVSDAGMQWKVGQLSRLEAGRQNFAFLKQPLDQPPGDGRQLFCCGGEHRAAAVVGVIGGG